MPLFFLQIYETQNTLASVITIPNFLVTARSRKQNTSENVLQHNIQIRYILDSICITSVSVASSLGNISPHLPY